MKLISAVSASLVLLGVVGCTQLDRALLNEEIRAEVKAEQRDVITIWPNGILTTNTSTVYTTNYFTNYVTNPTAELVVTGTQAIPVYGGLISVILGGLLGAYKGIRNKKLAEALVVATEAGRIAIREMDQINGKAADQVFKDAMVKQQTFLGVKGQAAQIVEKKTDKTT